MWAGALLLKVQQEEYHWAAQEGGLRQDERS